MYSAATIAVAYALMERLMVDIIVAPSGEVSAESDLQNSPGFATCSITFSQNVYSSYRKLKININYYFTD